MAISTSLPAFAFGFASLSDFLKSSLKNKKSHKSNLSNQQQHIIKQTPKTDIKALHEDKESSGRAFWGIGVSFLLPFLQPLCLWF